jgi:ketosteroid isomerase-like protein
MTRLTAEQMISLVEDSYFHNVDNKNLDPAVACFTEDAELTVQTAHTTHRGHGEIRRMFDDFMRETPVIYHGDFSHVTDVDNQLIASQFLARNNYKDGSEVSMRNCNFFVLEGGRFKKVTIYMSGENPLV